MKKTVAKKTSKKEFRNDQQTIATTQLKLQDMATALEYGSLPLDQRIQVKMPTTIINALDAAFPNVSRSKILTQLALDALIRHYRYSDDPDLQVWIDSEQEGLDRMWEYLEEREKE